MLAGCEERVSGEGCGVADGACVQAGRSKVDKLLLLEEKEERAEDEDVG